MKAAETRFLEFLKKSPQFIIPIYQRAYSWKKRECLQLWNDIRRTGNSHAITAHFIGSIVYIEESQYQVSLQSPLLVIDGQQRLTTIMLILEALARRLGGQELDGFSADKLRKYYLVNPLEKGDLRFKLLLTQTDKKTLLALMPGGPPQPPDKSIRITENFKLFKDMIDRLDGDDLAAFCRGLAKLMIVDIALSRDQDNPQLIFESMNSTGLELSQADLIRNFILMGLEPEHQTRLYEEHWRPMEIAFGQQAYEQHFDKFMRHYLTVKTGEIPKVREVYESFKKHAHNSKSKGAEADDLLAEVHTFARYYCAMALDQEAEANRELAEAFADLRELRADVVYPFLLGIYQDHKDGLLSAEEFKEVLRLTESYVFRRSVCAIPTNSMNKTFAEFKRFLKKEQGRYLESIRAHFQLLPSYRRFPSDEEFRREIKVRDLYHYTRCSYWLRRLENYDRKERAPMDGYTVEHILPQNQDLSPAWQDALGDDWRQVQEKWLHTLGNLTLTGYNSEYSDHSFAYKRDTKGGFKESPLRLNKGLGALETWDQPEIEKRAERLAKTAAQVWPAPGLSDEVLQRCRPKPSEEENAYTIEDHKHLADGGDTRELFESFRAEVLKLDPCISEEVRKHYIAYRAEINFIYLKAQKKQLQLWLSLQPYELHDPRKKAEDTGGRAKVRLQKPEELPYVMGLVRQAFEKQMEVAAENA